jgi:hypothetical protein
MDKHRFEFDHGDYVKPAEEIVTDPLKKLPHIAVGRDPDRTGYTLPSIVSFLVHPAPEGASPITSRTRSLARRSTRPAGSARTTSTTTSGSGPRKRGSTDSSVRTPNRFEGVGDVGGADTTDTPRFGDTATASSTARSRRYAHSSQFTTIGAVGDAASLSLVVHRLKNRILRTILRRVQALHHFPENQLDAEIERVSPEKASTAGYTSRHSERPTPSFSPGAGNSSR